MQDDWCTFRAGMSSPIYKICARQEWQAACEAGVYTGAPVDVADGFIHFSTAEQARETAAKHFAGQSDLVLVEIDLSRLPREVLKWEPSRGGALFPHLYGDLPTDAATCVFELPWDAETGHRFPPEWENG